MTQSVYDKFIDVVSIYGSGSDRQNEMVGPPYSTGPSTERLLTQMALEQIKLSW